MAKTILITAGSARIGASLASHLTNKGHKVIFTYNTSICKGANCYPLDLAREVEIIKFWDALDIKIDVLINNAAHFAKDTLANISFKSIEEHMSINLSAPILMTQQFVKQTSAGIVINLLDKWAKTQPQNFLSYSLSKNALETFTHHLNQHYAPSICAYGIELGFTLYNEKFPSDFFNTNKDLYPSSIEKLLSAVDFIISDAKVDDRIIDLTTWK